MAKNRRHSTITLPNEPSRFISSLGFKKTIIGALILTVLIALTLAYFRILREKRKMGDINSMYTMMTQIQTGEPWRIRWPSRGLNFPGRLKNHPAIGPTLILNSRETLSLSHLLAPSSEEGLLEDRSPFLRLSKGRRFLGGFR